MWGESEFNQSFRHSPAALSLHHFRNHHIDWRTVIIFWNMKVSTNSSQIQQSAGKCNVITITI